MNSNATTLFKRSAVALLLLLSVCTRLLDAGPEVNYPDLRIATEGEGMFYVSSSELALVLGVSAAEVEGVLAAGDLKMENNGAEVARAIAPAGAGFYFYGESVSDAYTDKNAYFVRWEAGVDMPAVSGAAPASALGGTYRSTIHIEQNNMPVTGALTDPTADFWVWSFFTADDVDTGTNDYEMVLSAVGSGGNQAVLDVRFIGWTDTGVTLEHHARISVNGNPVGDVYWQGKTAKTDSLSFDSGFLQDGTNVIRVAGMLDTGAENSQFYLDDIDITYDRKFEAVADQLGMHSTTNAVVTVTELTGSNVYVADITSPMLPVLLSGVTVDSTNSQYWASFAPSNSVTPYVVFDGSAGLLADSIEPLSEVDLKAVSNEYEYVIITVPDLQEAAQLLADHRQGQRLDSKVVLLQDIYNQFNHGIADPNAIKNFVGYAYSNWVNSLRYVLLAGSGTYDYKGTSGAADQHVPPMLLSRSLGLTASDTWYGDVEGNWAPEVSIGRLPAVTAEDMTNLVDRVIAHEGTAGNAWRQTIVMCADNPDSGGNFHVSSEDVSGIVPGGYSQEKILMASGGAAAASNQLKTAISSGALFVNFFGHSGLRNLAHEKIFNSSDVAALGNTNRLPVVTSMSCSMGRFEIPEYDCLGETLMLDPTGGAIAVFAPSSRAMNRDSHLLCKEFYVKVFGNSDWILGDAVRAAMKSYAGMNVNRELLMFYNLLGDPALYLAEMGAPTDDPYGPVVPEVTNWKTNYYNVAELDDPAVSGDFSDSDDDGLSTLAEYAFGRNPTVDEQTSFVSMTKKDKVVLVEDYDVVLEFSRRKGLNDIVINAQVTSDFSDWRRNDLDIVHTQVVDNGDGVTETVKHYLKAPVDVDRLFITMTVEKTK